MSPEHVAAVLADFQAWLSALPAPLEETTAEATEGPDLFTLLEQLTALRHEVNLQTKATRSQQEQNAATIAQLTRTLDALQQSQAAAGQERDDRLRPILKSLIDLYDALAVAGREAQRVQDAILPAIQEAIDRRTAEFPQLPPVSEPSGLARWLGVRSPDLSAYQAAVTAWRKRELEDADRQRQEFTRIKQFLVSLTTGYTMGLQRIERALKQHALQVIPAVGQAFDPERMEAVEAVTDSGQSPGQVLSELQRGYLWNGRVFRYARVRVAK
jgi:molecular chaperone GrpE